MARDKEPRKAINISILKRSFFIMEASFLECARKDFCYRLRR